MKGNADLKGLRNGRTAISTHSRSTSRHKGTPYLEILALGMEKLRLETEVARLTKRVARIEARLGEIGHTLEDRLNTVAEGAPTDSSAPTPRRGPPIRGRGWKTVSVEY